ncbi:MAG: sugar porter family MFS transporter [Phycisphaerales bacterium]|nr:sugar porter family MFS transporter [Phycisphaerales bacterium]
MTTAQSKDVQARSGSYTVAVALVAAVGGLMFGYDIGVISFAKEGVKNAFKLGTFEIEVVVAAVLAGSFAGAIVAGKLCDRIGRRWTNVWGGILFAVGCLGCSLSYDFWMITAFRIMMGLGVGFSSVAGPLYIAEIAAPWSRGAMVSLYQLAITLGILIAFLIGLAMPDLWRIHFGIGIVLGLGLVFGMLVMPPSPRWLVGRGRVDTALGVLKRTTGSDTAAKSELEAIKVRVKEEAGEHLLTELSRSPAVRRALFLAFGLALLQQFSGINAIMFYAPEILKEIGLVKHEYLLTAMIGVVNVLATFIAIWLVDRLGRRVLLLAGTSLMMLSQIGIGIFAFWIPTGAAAADGTGSVPMAGIFALVMIFLAIIAFAFSLGPLVWLVISEIFPAGVRSACVGVATAANWTGAFIVALFTLTVLENKSLGTSSVFWIFAGSNIVAIIFIYLKLPETKGAKLEDIEGFFSAKNSKSARDHS